MNIPLLDLSHQFSALGDEISEAVGRVLGSQQFILGPEVSQFEREFADYVGTPYALGVSSGSDALIISLMCLGVGEGDEVITTPFTFFASAGAIARLGATPVFVDIDPVSFNILPSAIEEAITDRTKAIMPVHLFGQAAEMSEIIAIAKKYEIPILEDSAQSNGATYKGVQLGALGDFGCFSFFPSKNLGGAGDGGMVTCRSEEIYKRLVSLRNHGSSPTQRYVYDSVGGNFRLDTLQAAILSVKLPHLNAAIDKRRENAELYRSLFSEILPAELAEQVQLPTEVAHCKHTYNQFVVRMPARDTYLELARERGIAAAVYYPKPLHLQDCFLPLGYEEGDFPESEKACSEVVALPIYPEVPELHQRKIVECIKDAIEIAEVKVAA